MPNLMEMLQGQLSDNLVDQLSQQLGGADKEKTAIAANGVLSALVSQIARNASTPEGASSLANALDRDHDGSVLDDLMGMIGGGNQANNRALNGEGIIRHVMGDRQNNVLDMISKMSGLDKGSTGNLMTTLAPIVMGMLGKQKREQGLDIGGLTSLLTGELKQQRQSDNPAMSMISRFIDADGDGDIKDDIADMGMKFLGNLFKKK
ncbi:MAG: DUF937 domain-containing protein [Saprospiraceae bacterium]